MRVNGKSNYKQPGQRWVPKLVYIYIYEWRALFYRVKGINQEKEVLLILILIKTPGGDQPSLQENGFVSFHRKQIKFKSEIQEENWYYSKLTLQHLHGPIQGTVH